MSDNIGDFETKAEHAAWLGVSKRTVDNYRNEPGGLPFTKRGRLPLFCRAWTLAWLESRRRQNNPRKQRAA